MKAALEQSDIKPEHKEFLWEYFNNTAEFLRNR